MQKTKLMLVLMLGLLALTVGCSSSEEIASSGDGVVRLVFFWSDT